MWNPRIKKIQEKIIFNKVPGISLLHRLILRDMCNKVGKLLGTMHRLLKGGFLKEYK